MSTNVFDVFTPGAAVDSIEKFAGRQAELDTLADALQTSGVNIVIYGNRGVGKSSLAVQLEALARGEAGVVDRLTHKPLKQLDFLPLDIQVDDSIPDVENLIRRLLTSNSALAAWVPYDVETRTEKGGAGARAGFGPVALKAGYDSTVSREKPAISPDFVAIFKNTLQEIEASRVASSGILIIVDEFGRIKDAAGFASLLKSFERTSVRFAIVGVASDVEELVTDHASIERQVAGGTVHVPPMTDLEIRKIFEHAHSILKDAHHFSKDAIQYVTAASRGHPYLVHVLGHQALIAAAREGTRRSQRKE